MNAYIFLTISRDIRKAKICFQQKIYQFKNNLINSSQCSKEPLKKNISFLHKELEEKEGANKKNKGGVLGDFFPGAKS